jgi:small-conductance mechanosensitive channel
MTDADLLAGTLLLILATFVVALLLWLLRRAAALIPLRRSRQGWLLRRALPVAEVVIVVAAIIWVAVLLLGDQPVLATGAFLAVAGIVIAAGWFAVRDVIAGSVLRAEDLYEPGQWIRAGDLEGRIERVGARSIEIEGEDGIRVRIPYALLATQPVARSARAESAQAHTFTIRIDDDTAPLEAASRIRRAALESFYATPTREPHVRQRGGGRGEGSLFEVTVYSTDRRFFSEIERDVRRRMARLRA